MKIKYILTIVIAILAYGVSQGQDYLTLDEAIARALDHNHDIQAARNDEKVAKNKANIGYAGLLPRIDLSATSRYLDETLSDSLGGLSTHTTSNTAQIQASYTLFDGLSNIYQYRLLKAGGEQGRLQARNSIELTIVDVSRAYYNVASAFERLSIAREALKISNDRLFRARKRSEYGQARTIDVLAAEVDLNSDSTSLLNAQLDYNEARRELNSLLNRDINIKFAIDTDVDYLDDPGLNYYQTKAFKNNAAYLLTANFLKQAKYSLGMANSKFLPRLDLSASYGYMQSSPDFKIDYSDPIKDMAVSATLSFNIFNGFRDKIDRQNAKLTVKNQQLYKDQLELELTNDVINAYELYNNSLTVLALQQRNLESAELNFQRTEELYNLGQANTTTFREAQLNLISARNSISTAKFNAKLNELHLLRLAGLLFKEI